MQIPTIFGTKARVNQNQSVGYRQVWFGSGSATPIPYIFILSLLWHNLLASSVFYSVSLLDMCYGFAVCKQGERDWENGYIVKLVL